MFEVLGAAYYLSKDVDAKHFLSAQDDEVNPGNIILTTLRDIIIYKTASRHLISTLPVPLHLTPKCGVVNDSKGIFYSQVSDSRLIKWSDGDSLIDCKPFKTGGVIHSLCRHRGEVMVVFEGGSVRSVQTKGKEVQMLGEGDAVSRVVVGERFVAIVAKGKASADGPTPHRLYTFPRGSEDPREVSVQPLEREGSSLQACAFTTYKTSYPVHDRHSLVALWSDGVLTTSIVEHSKNNSSKGPQGLWSIGSKDLKPFLNTDMPCALLQVNQGNLAVVGQHVSHDGGCVVLVSRAGTDAWNTVIGTGRKLKMYDPLLRVWGAGGRVLLLEAHVTCVPLEENRQAFFGKKPHVALPQSREDLQGEVAESVEDFLSSVWPASRGSPPAMAADATSWDRLNATLSATPSLGLHDTARAMQLVLGAGSVQFCSTAGGEKKDIYADSCLSGPQHALLSLLLLTSSHPPGAPRPNVPGLLRARLLYRQATWLYGHILASVKAMPLHHPRKAHHMEWLVDIQDAFQDEMAQDELFDVDALQSLPDLGNVNGEATAVYNTLAALLLDDTKPPFGERGAGEQDPWDTITRQAMPRSVAPPKSLDTDRTGTPKAKTPMADRLQFLNRTNHVREQMNDVNGAMDELSVQESKKFKPDPNSSLNTSSATPLNTTPKTPKNKKKHRNSTVDTSFQTPKSSNSTPASITPILLNSIINPAETELISTPLPSFTKKTPKSNKTPRNKSVGNVESMDAEISTPLQGFMKKTPKSKKTPKKADRSMGSHESIDSEISTPAQSLTKKTPKSKKTPKIADRSSGNGESVDTSTPFMKRTPKAKNTPQNGGSVEPMEVGTPTQTNGVLEKAKGTKSPGSLRKKQRKSMSK